MSSSKIAKSVEEIEDAEIVVEVEKKLYKVVSKPEGNPSFVDVLSGYERPFMRQTIVLADNENIAKKTVEAMNWDCHIAGEELIYEVVSVEEEGV
jgi:hypothetical protein